MKDKRAVGQAQRGKITPLPMVSMERMEASGDVRMETSQVTYYVTGPPPKEDSRNDKD